MNTKNGKTTLDGLTGTGPTPEQIADVHAMLTTLTPQIRAVVGTMVRGLMVSLPGVAPPAILQMLCYEVANCVGQALQGDLTTLASIRKGYREAFEEGLRKAPIVQTPPAGSMPLNLRGDS